MDGVLAGNHWDLGSNPRSPQILFVLFPQVFQYKACKEVHHVPHASACHVAPSLDPMVKSGGLPYSQSTSALGNYQSQTGLRG